MHTHKHIRTPQTTYSKGIPRERKMLDVIPYNLVALFQTTAQYELTHNAHQQNLHPTVLSLEHNTQPELQKQQTNTAIEEFTWWFDGM